MELSRNKWPIGGRPLDCASSPERGEWLGKARVQMRSNGRASQLRKRLYIGARKSIQDATIGKIRSAILYHFLSS